jgi:hypothetical protein
MKKGPIEDDRIYETLSVVLREFFAEYTDVCPVASAVAMMSGFPLVVVEEHLRELELRRVLVLRQAANTTLRPRPNDTYWLNDYQLRRFAKQAPEDMQSFYSRYFRTFVKAAS